MNDYRQGGFSFLPPVVKNLVIINVIMFLATMFFQSQGTNLNDILGLHYYSSEKFRVYQFVSYMFMHGSFTHIFFNMLALFMFGGAVENYWGGKRFLNYYFLTGFGAAVLHYIIVYYQINPTIQIFSDYIKFPDMGTLSEIMNAYPDSFSDSFHQLLISNPAEAMQESIRFVSEIKQDILNGPVVIGASGAIYGILLAFGMLFPNSIIYLFLALPIKAKYAVVVFGVIELYLGVNGGGNVAHFAHLGGLLTGLIIILIWNKGRFRKNDFFE